MLTWNVVHVKIACILLMEEEGTSSLRAELAALLQLELSAEPQRDLLALLDCQIEMTELRKWIGEGHRATLADKVNADILKEIIEALRRRVEAGGSRLPRQSKSTSVCLARSMHK